jgi:hypothetical protein
MLIPARREGNGCSRQESLSFSPWNTTYDLRPLGSLNGVGKAIHEFSSGVRREPGDSASGGFASAK